MSVMQRQVGPPPSAPDRTVYLVLDDFGRLGSAYRETDPADANLETVVADLLSGQYSHPLGVVAFNTAQGWSRDVTGEVARELLAHAAALDDELAPHVREFLERASPASKVNVPPAPEPAR
jgi:hypothetical protein